MKDLFKSIVNSAAYDFLKANLNYLLIGLGLTATATYFHEKLLLGLKLLGQQTEFSLPNWFLISLTILVLVLVFAICHLLYKEYRSKKSEPYEYDHFIGVDWEFFVGMDEDIHNIYPICPKCKTAMKEDPNARYIDMVPSIGLRCINQECKFNKSWPKSEVDNPTGYPQFTWYVAELIKARIRQKKNK